ncbi:MAG: FG-GAP-like repeat-containing protein [Candidatus Peribacter sp.]|nr:FG-GAP-like repeat-containing protein [Candidatus Peribacter sp.]
MPSLRLRWPSLLLPLGLFAVIAGVIITLRSETPWTAQTVAPLCGNGAADPGENCMEPGLGTCATGQECIQCRCQTPDMNFRCGNTYGRTGGCSRAGALCIISCLGGSRVVTGKCDANRNCYGSCGDGIVHTGEQCDTGDSNSTACTEYCTVRSGWTCTGSPSRCTMTDAAASASAAASAAYANQPDIILDDAQGFLTSLGSWTTASVGFRGAQHVHDSGPQDWNRPLEYGGFSATIPTPGDYGIYVTWSPNSTFSDRVTLSIHRSYGYVGSPSDNTAWARTDLNQRSNPSNSWSCDGKQWQYIGRIAVDSTNRYVGAFFSTGNGAPRNSRFAVDAVMFVPESRRPNCGTSSSASSGGAASSAASSQSSALSAPALCTASILPAPQIPAWLTSEDFNRDGHPDLAVLGVHSFGSAGGQLSIYLNRGNGTFLPKADVGGTLFQGIAAGDFDRDGAPDLVLSNNNGSLSVLRNNGAGQFPTSPQQITLSPSMSVPEQIAVGDINQDGDPDLLVGSLNEGANVLYGAAGLGFTSGPRLGTTGGNQMNPTLVDVNADGSLDAITTPGGANGPKLVVYLNDRTGHFDSGTSYDSTGNPYTLNLFTGDLNGDGKIDLVQATNQNKEVIVWVNNGNGTFRQASKFTASGGARDGALADFNGDGKLDFFAGNYVWNFFFHRGNGDGTFGPSQSITFPVVGRQVVAKDFDRNGFPDIAMALAENQNGVLVFLNNGSCLSGGPAASSAPASSAPVSSAAARSITITSPNGGETCTVGLPCSLAWTSGGLGDDSIAIDIVNYATNNNGAPIQIVNAAWGVKASDGSYSWTPVSNITPGTRFKIRVYDEDHSVTPVRVTEDSSDNFFTIVAPPVSSQSSSASAGSTGACTDSDAGRNFTVVGTITNFLHGNQVVPSFGDVCFKDNNHNPAIDPNILLEGYCGDDGYGHLDQFRCPDGCENGVCLLPSGTACLDSDGDNWTVQGTTIEYFNGVPVPGRHATDYCNDASTVTEYTCDPSRHAIGNSHPCPSGCQNGACPSATQSSVSSAAVSSASSQGATCGNGRIDAPAENCDDGNSNNGDGCSSICRFECTDTDPSNDPGVRGTVRSFYCSNGTLSCGESVQQDSCVPGATDQITEYSCSENAPYYGAVSAFTHRCSGSQQCQNGICGHGTAQSSSSSAAVCGNARVEGNEQCDDGNANNGDGCYSPTASNPCTVESGWTCTGSPSVCTMQRPTLTSVVINGQNVTVIYSKVFDTCAHLLSDPGSSLVHTQNVFCEIGTNITVTQPLSEVRVTAGQRVKLCHGNNANICSAVVTVTSGSGNPPVCGNGVREGNERCEVGVACPQITCLVAPCPQPRCDYRTCTCIICPAVSPPACPGGVLFPQLGTDANGCERPPVCCEGAASGGQCTTNMSCTNGRCVVDSCTCTNHCAAPTPPACPGGVLFPQLGVDADGCQRPPVCCEGAASGGQCTTNMSCTNGRCIVDSCTCTGPVSSASSSISSSSSRSSSLGPTHKDCQGPNGDIISVPIDQPCPTFSSSSSASSVSPAHANLAILNFTGFGNVAAGAATTYTVYITNAGPDTVPNVYLDFFFPDGFSFIPGSSSEACTLRNATGVRCIPGNGTMATDASATFTIGVQFPATCATVGYMQAVLDSPDVIETFPSNNQQTLVSNVICSPSSSSSSSSLAAVCGNTIRENTEPCDDGNTAGSDGCSSACQVESGWTCSDVCSEASRQDHWFSFQSIFASIFSFFTGEPAQVASTCHSVCTRQQSSSSSVQSSASSQGFTFIRLNHSSASLPLSSNALFGTSLTSVGDVDSDGTPDLAVFAPGPDDPDESGFVDPSKAHVYILHLTPQGSVKSFDTITYFVSDPILERISNGGGITAVGDLDGNGVTDLAVATEFDTTNASPTLPYYSGKVVVLLLQKNSAGVVSVRSQYAISAPTYSPAHCGSSNPTQCQANKVSLFGSSVAYLGGPRRSLVIGSVNGAWYSELSATSATAPAQLEGSYAHTPNRMLSVANAGVHPSSNVHLLAAPSQYGIDFYYVNAEDQMQSTSRIVSVDSAIGIGPSDTGTLAMAGDMDGNGIDDLFVSGNSGYPSYLGRTTKILLQKTGGYLQPKAMETMSSFTDAGGATDTAGGFVAAIGDIDGDGKRDFAVGIPQSTGGGAVWLLLSKPAA